MERIILIDYAAGKFYDPYAVDEPGEISLAFRSVGIFRVGNPIKVELLQ